jgi:hypothetical protein
MNGEPIARELQVKELRHNIYNILEESREQKCSSKRELRWRERASFQWECHTRRRIKEIVFLVFYFLCVRVYLGVHGVWACRECF